MNNQLITAESQNLVNEAVAILEAQGMFGISERLVRSVERECEVYVRAMKNSGDDFARRDALVADYNENMIRCLIRNAKEEARS